MNRCVYLVLILVSAASITVGCERRVEPENITTSTRSSDPSGTTTAAAEINTSLGRVMLLIPAGEYVMGGGDDVDTLPEHRVTVDAFYMDRYEVTQDLYEQVTGSNPSRRAGDKHPVERVRWTDAIRFCNRLSRHDGLTPCYDLQTWACDFSADGYRLPTESEWEYACRAGSVGDYCFDGGSAQLDNYAWHKGNARRKHQAVGQKESNAFGLYDMLGNVREWCHDRYAADYYAQSPGVNPRGPDTGDKAVLRGGAFSATAASCTCWARYCDEAGFTDACVAGDDYGFRCVRRLASSP